MNIPTHSEELLAFTLAKALWDLSEHQDNVALQDGWNKAEEFLPGIGHTDVRNATEQTFPFVSKLDHEALSQHGANVIVAGGDCNIKLTYANGALKEYKYIAKDTPNV